LPRNCPFCGRQRGAKTVKPSSQQAFFLFGTALAAMHSTLQRAARNERPRLCASRAAFHKARLPMDYVKPADVAKTMAETGSRKLALSIPDLLIRGMLSGAILGVATSLAFNAAFTTGQPLVGAMVFPVGIIMIVLLGLELITGSFALVPLPWMNGDATASQVLANFAWVFLGNLIGCVAYGALLVIALTDMGAIEPAGVAARLIAAAEAKTTGYAAFGFAGMVTVFVKAMLCNWMVCLSVVLAMSSTSTIGKVATAWIPIMIFFAQGFEHTVVNMFIIPTGMMMGAKVSVAQWWLWNQIPVTLGNFVGGFFFTGLAIYVTYRPKSTSAPVLVPSASGVPAE
jgi:formate/nitrite transporter